MEMLCLLLYARLYCCNNIENSELTLPLASWPFDELTLMSEFTISKLTCYCW